MIYPQNFEEKIGFAHLREYVRNRCSSILGKKECDEMAFSLDFKIVEKSLNEVSEFLTIINGGEEFPLTFIGDINEELQHCKVEGTYLTEAALFNLKRSLDTMSDVARFFTCAEDEPPKYPALADVASDMMQFPLLSKEIASIIDKFGNIRDNASQKLVEIHRQIDATTAGINGMMRRILAQGRDAGYLDKDVTPSMRDGRLVIPVAPMYKRKIKGIVHDESATGKTVFIEPAELVEANNTIRELEAELRREIIRILIATTSVIRPYIHDIIASLAILGRFDFIRAKAITASQLGGTLPHLNPKPELEWYHAIHPVLYLSLKEQGKEVVPLNISLTAKDRILLISGPNAGGKSVCLKTVGIIQYMTQCGMLPLVYENSHIGIFKNIFIDIGDEQSIEDDLSTYSSHLLNMKYFINHSNRHSLILIDEFGGGTEPQIGGAIAQAILHNLNDKKSWGVITTHYQNLKHFAEENQGIINGAMLYDRQHLMPLFQLAIGYPGSSFAVEIARKIGLPSEVISEAEEIVGSDYINMDKYLLDIARDRKYWENKRSEIKLKEKRIAELEERYEEDLANIKGQRMEILKAARTEAKEIMKDTNARIERTILEIRKSQADKERTKELRKELDEFRERLAAEIEEHPFPKHKNCKKPGKQPKKAPAADGNESISVGDCVVLDGGNTVGKVVSISGKSAETLFGSMKMTIQLNRLKKTMRKETDEPARKSTASDNDIRTRQLSFSPDIDVRGMSVDEATQAITYFLDDAIQFNAKRVRILHGTGNGILRQRLREYINTFAGVKSYRDEHIQFGGAGITVVDLE